MTKTVTNSHLMLYLVSLDPSPDSLDVFGDLETTKLAPGLFLTRSSLTQSQLYHLIKRRAAPNALLVGELTQNPKFKGMEAGAMKWLRSG